MENLVSDTLLKVSQKAGKFRRNTVPCHVRCLCHVFTIAGRWISRSPTPASTNPSSRRLWLRQSAACRHYRMVARRAVLSVYQPALRLSALMHSRAPSQSDEQHSGAGITSVNQAALKTQFHCENSPLLALWRVRSVDIASTASWAAFTQLAHLTTRRLTEVEIGNSGGGDKNFVVGVEVKLWTYGYKLTHIYRVNQTLVQRTRIVKYSLSVVELIY